MRSKYEIQAHKELVKEGYKVDYKLRGKYVPRNYTVDYFNCFDLMAYRAGELRFIAIKGHQGIPGSLRTAISELELPDGCQKEIWTYRKKLGIKKEIINN